MKQLNFFSSSRKNDFSNRTIKFFTLGCKANQYDTQSIRERFLSKGFQEEGREKKPDYFLVNTCTVTAGADQKSRNIIRRCIQENPRAKVIVTGCLAEKDGQSLAAIQGVGLIIKKSFFPEGVTGFSAHTRAFLKIQDGCSNFCTYCKVALVRGKPRSKKISKIVQEARQLVNRGYQEIVLTGICLGAYGKGISPKKDLADVIAELENIEGLLRIRLSSIEAGDISLRLIKRMQASKKLCAHLHIPIQSGDDQILKRMNRRYTHQEYRKLIVKLRRSIPDLSITTDCLVGFPGETEENFSNTINLVNSIGPLKAHIFGYSPRPGTKAAGFSGLIDPATLRDRCQRLEKAALLCREKFMREFIGRKTVVLIEGMAKNSCGLLEGLTHNYLKVYLPFRPGLRNKLVLAQLKSFKEDGFLGEYIDKL